MAPDLNEFDDILNSFAVEYILGLSRSTTLRLLRSGTIPGKKIGRQWRILKSDLLLFLKTDPRSHS